MQQESARTGSRQNSFVRLEKIKAFIRRVIDKNAELTDVELHSRDIRTCRGNPSDATDGAGGVELTVMRKLTTLCRVVVPEADDMIVFDPEESGRVWTFKENEVNKCTLLLARMMGVPHMAVAGPE